MRDIESLFSALERSAFRRRFRLGGRELAYLEAKGARQVLSHAVDFVAQRLAPADPPNDGKQTPYRGHPVFVAQHATGTCCRGCLEKWHRIPRGRALTVDEQNHVLAVIGRWLGDHLGLADGRLGAFPRSAARSRSPRRGSQGGIPPMKGAADADRAGE